MNQRNILFSLIAVSAAIFVSYSWYSVEPPLIVYLRCERKVTGILQAKIIWPSGKRDKTKNFDIQKICNNGKIEFDDYKREEIVKFIFKWSNDKKA